VSGRFATVTRTLIVALCLLLLSVGACAPPMAVVTSDGLVHQRFGYRVAGCCDGAGFISDDWTVESHAADGSTKPLFSGDTTWAIDIERGGAEEPLERAPNYDLLLHHRHRSTSIWLRTFPVSTAMSATELSALTERYLDNVGALGPSHAGLSAGGSQHLQAGQFPTRLLDTRRIGIDGQEAEAVLFDVAGVTPLARGAANVRALVAIARTPLHYRIRTGRGVGEWPVILLAGVAAAPADFDASLADFQKFLQAIDLDP